MIGSSTYDRIGLLTSITRYPVKSMAGEALDSAELHWPWLLGDRQFAFVRGSDSSAFPWLTARQLPSLVRFSARYERADDPLHSPVIVRDPDGNECDVRDPALALRLSEAAGTPVWLLRLGRGCFDAMPVSLVLSTTVASVAREHGGAVAIERFRSNLVVEPVEPEASEADWLGRSIAIGTAALDVGWSIPRCAMIGVDPSTGMRDANLVRTVVRRFGNQVGVYCAVRQPGRLGVGETVSLITTKR